MAQRLAGFLLVLVLTVAGVAQGAAVAIPGSFRSGVHRARFSPHDGHLYVSGSGGWGTYTPDDGCLQRVRVVAPPQLPVAWEARENGVLLRFSQPVDRAAVDQLVALVGLDGAPATPGPSNMACVPVEIWESRTSVSVVSNALLLKTWKPKQLEELE